MYGIKTDRVMRSVQRDSKAIALGLPRVEAEIKHLEGVKKITIENLKKLGFIRKSTLKVKIFGEGKLSEQPSDENIRISKGVKIG